MAVVQDAYFIPDDIATGLAIGIYRRIGSVVRHAVGPNKGQIVKHLKPIDLKHAEPAQGIVGKVVDFTLQHKKGVGIATAGAFVAGMTIWGFDKWKNREPKVLTDFRAALKIYIEAIRSGSMDIDKIDNLMNALEALKKHKNYDKISIQLTTEQLEVLVGRIRDYTIKLVADNLDELNEDEIRLGEGTHNGVIVHLQTYLDAQKKIFEKVV